MVPRHEVGGLEGHEVPHLVAPFLEEVGGLEYPHYGGVGLDVADDHGSGFHVTLSYECAKSEKNLSGVDGVEELGDGC